MDRLERWFLEVAIELRQPLRGLIGPLVAQAFNREHHGLDVPGVADALRSLLSQGFIALSQRGGEPLVDHEAALRVLVGETGETSPFASPYYGVTSSGGAAWERVAHPNWDRYIDASLGTEPEEAQVICADPARLDEYALSSYQRFPPVTGTVQRDRVARWQATYWKGLPGGHRLRYAYGNERSPSWDHAYLLQEAAWLREMNTWFTA